MMSRTNKLERCVRSVSAIMSDLPLTLKLRTGVKSQKPIAHKLIPKLQDWGIQMVTVSVHNDLKNFDKLYILYPCVTPVPTPTCKMQSNQSTSQLISYISYMDVVGSSDIHVQRTGNTYRNVLHYRMSQSQSLVSIEIIIILYQRIYFHTF